MNDNGSGALLRFTLIFSMIFVLFSMRQNNAPLKALEGCETGLKQIGVDLEYYQREHRRYPESLDKIQNLPRCPGGESPSTDPYLTGYEPNEDGTAYRLVCRGHRHQKAGIPADYPRIHSPNLESGSSAKAVPKKADTEEQPPQEPEPEPEPEAVESPSAEEPTPEPQGSPEVEPTPGVADPE